LTLWLYEKMKYKASHVLLKLVSVEEFISGGKLLPMLSMARGVLHARLVVYPELFLPPSGFLDLSMGFIVGFSPSGFIPGRVAGAYGPRS
jgi:hypothetical protein